MASCQAALNRLKARHSVDDDLVDQFEQILAPEKVKLPTFSHKKHKKITEAINDDVSRAKRIWDHLTETTRNAILEKANNIPAEIVRITIEFAEAWGVIDFPEVVEYSDSNTGSYDPYGQYTEPVSTSLNIPVIPSGLLKKFKKFLKKHPATGFLTGVVGCMEAFLAKHRKSSKKKRKKAYNLIKLGGVYDPILAEGVETRKQFLDDLKHIRDKNIDRLKEFDMAINELAQNAPPEYREAIISNFSERSKAVAKNIRRRTKQMLKRNSIPETKVLMT